MNPERISSSRRAVCSQVPFRGRRHAGRERSNERKEAFVLLAIAILLVANVVLYLCHHYGLTSQNDTHRRPAPEVRVVLD